MKSKMLAGMFVGSMLYEQAQPTWVTMRDTREGAFSIEVPQGWKATGGMFRYNGLNARPYVDMLSPDGKIDLRIGDTTIPNYMSPGPMHHPGPGVAPYASGDIVATKYREARFGGVCQNVRVTKTGAVAPKYGKPGMGPVRVTAGEAGSVCTQNGREMTGFVYAETMLVGGRYESTWYVTRLASFLAPTPQIDTAGAMLKRSGESIAFNPEWARDEQQRIQAATNAVIGISNWTREQTKEMNERQDRFNRTRAQESDNFNDVILGQTFTRDPHTGLTRTVYTGTGAKKWTNGSSVVIDSTMSLGPAYRQLDVISH